MIAGTVKYLVFDVESVPDGRLINHVKYNDRGVDDAQAIDLYREEIIASGSSSGFIPVTFQYPVALVIAKVRDDYSLDDVVSLDEPAFRSGEITRLFWKGVEKNYAAVTLVSFNGRGFDIPLMELMAFRYGVRATHHFRDNYSTRHRYGARHLDLHDWLSNYNAVRLNGGLDLLAKVIGKPGKMDTRGDQVYELYRQGELRRISDYCIHDVLDTYFVFLRTRVMNGELSLEREQEAVRTAKGWIEKNRERIPAFQEYLKNWGDWDPWP
ncbi:MAG: 3'-5' exonuclease [Spirochaetes bacterium]|nr:3'-5' exonuclease [Spirochaetota bacterium]